jgi:hypothetical protein
MCEIATFFFFKGKNFYRKKKRGLDFFENKVQKKSVKARLRPIKTISLRLFGEIGERTINCEMPSETLGQTLDKRLRGQN